MHKRLRIAFLPSLYQTRIKTQAFFAARADYFHIISKFSRPCAPPWRAKNRLAHGKAAWYNLPVVKKNSHGCAACFRSRKKVRRMKNNDFITVTGWVFSLLSLLLAVYMLGKGL